MHFKIIIISLLTLALCTQSFSGQLLELRNQKNDILQSFVSHTQSNIFTTLNEISRYTDANQMTHIRIQEFYRGYPVWNARAVIHIPYVNISNHDLSALLSLQHDQKSMNGQLYQYLDKDLSVVSSIVFSKKQAEQAVQIAIKKFKSTLSYFRKIQINHTKYQLMIFVDNQKVAHWVYKVTFRVQTEDIGRLPAKPVYIIDAINFMIYQYWDDIKTDYVNGGGYGGNPNTGKLIYDGLANHLSSFLVKREANECYLETKDLIVINIQTNKAIHYTCMNSDPEHNGVYWSGNFDTINDGYSPANDAIFDANVLKQFYKNWYNMPILVNNDGSDMKLVMNVHYPKLDNAFWDGESMTFGDGIQLYPLTSLNIAAHEVSHGFTQQHSDLIYAGQSGGMNEAFSDMAAQTAEYYSYGKSSWLIGSDVIKLKGEALRYMDQPSKDCHGKEPGTYCSIDRADQYYDGLDVHFSSGVYNYAFYLLSNMPGWDPRKAFAVMLHANASYWLSLTTFKDGAACVVKAAEDLHYNKNDVEKVFDLVGLHIDEFCTNSRV
jgi:pseudolysin